jgi:anti-sigma factor RsiW
MKDEKTMTDREQPVTEAELHAYVDGELPADRREAVAAWLAAHPNEAATVAAWRAQAEAIRARFGAVADEPVPARLRLDAVMRNGTGGMRRLVAFAAAAAVVAFVVGGAAGWMARGASAAAPSSAGDFTADALEAHKLYVVEVRHPVEVPGAERAHMTQWLTKRLGYDQRIPDLSAIGLKLVGGRLLPGPTGAAAFYMYEGPSGERYTLYCSKVMTSDSALRFDADKSFAAFYWVDDKVGYAVSGPDDREKLEKVTKAIYEQMDRTGTKKS